MTQDGPMPDTHRASKPTTRTAYRHARATEPTLPAGVPVDASRALVNAG